MSAITYVAQEESDGCLVACIAMATGRTYAEIRAIVAASYSGGIHSVIAHDVLADLGYAVMVRYKHIPHLKRNRDAWPIAPFAPVHICGVDATTGPHAIVLLDTGEVYDPWTRDRHDLLHSDYTQIDHIDGVFKVIQ